LLAGLTEYSSNANNSPGHPMATTTTMLGKHSRDDDALEEERVHECSKRQRIEVESTPRGLLDMPCEVLSNIASYLDAYSAQNFWATSKQCNRAVRDSGMSSLCVNLFESGMAERLPVWLNTWDAAGFFNAENTHMTVVLDIRPPSLTNGALMLAHVTTLMRFANGKCRVLELAVHGRGHTGNSVISNFFDRLCESFAEGWQPTYGLHTVTVGLSQFPGVGRFLKRFKCPNVSLTSGEIRNVEDAKAFSNCAMVELIGCCGVTVDHVMALQHCKVVHLMCNSYGSLVADQDAIVAALSQCEVVLLTHIDVTDVGIRALEGCKRVGVYKCSGVTRDALDYLYAKGVEVTVDGDYWPPPPKAGKNTHVFSRMSNIIGVRDNLLDIF